MSTPDSRDLVFISYSHADPSWCKRLIKLLTPFVYRGTLRVWSDSYIEAGDQWRREIDAALDRARVGVVLLNEDVLASKFIDQVELPRLLSAARAGHLRLIVVPIDHVPTDAASFLADYQWSGGSPTRPLSSFKAHRRTGALVEVTEAIVAAMGSAAPIGAEPIVEPRAAAAPVTTADRIGDLHWLPPPPPYFAHRAGEHDRLKKALLGGAAIVGISAQSPHLGIHGQGGIGKSVLAWGIAQDSEIRSAFPDGIFWLTLGQAPNLKALQSRLAEAVRPSSNDATSPQGTIALRERLESRSCLVILDDVWEPAHAAAFDVLSGASRLLVTTRLRGVLSSIGADELSVDALDEDAALDLLSRCAGVPVDSLSNEAAFVAASVGCLPLGLSLLGALARDGKSWPQIADALTAGDVEFRNHPYASILKAVRASVDALDATEADRYFELSIFPDDVEVPVRCVALLWRQTGGMSASATSRLLARLERRNLIGLSGFRPASSDDARPGPESRATDSRVVAMHDLQRDFVQLMVDDARAVHRAFVAALRGTLREAPAGRDAADRWTTLAKDAAYAWDQLAYHLAQAGLDQELAELLTSAAWVEAKLQRSSVATLVRDYEQESVDPALREIGRALVLSAHVLARSPEQLLGQLAGRLQHVRDARVRRLIDARPAASPDAVRFRPMSTCLTPPGRGLIRELAGQQTAIWGIIVLADGRRAVTGAVDGSLFLWDLATGTALSSVQGPAGLRGVVGLLDTRRALSTSLDGSMRVWDLERGALLRTLEGHSKWARTVVMLPDGRRALSASLDGTLKLWDLDDGVHLHTFEGHSQPVHSVALHPDGRHALSASRDCTLTLWDLDAYADVRTFIGHTDWVTGVAIHPDGRRALSASNDGTVKLWDLDKTTAQHTFQRHEDKVDMVAILADGRRAISIARTTLRVWDIDRRELLRTVEGPYRAALLSDGQRVLATSLSDDMVRLWDLSTGEVLTVLEGHTDTVWVLAPFPDGRRALSAAWDTTLKLWDLTAAVQPAAEGRAQRVSDLTVLPDKAHALSASGDHSLKLLDLTTNTVLKALSGHESSVRAVALLRYGRAALSASDDGTLILWDIEAAARVRALGFRERGVNAIAPLADDLHVLLACDDTTVKLLDLVMDRVDRVFEGHTYPVNCVTLMPDGRRFVTGSNDGTLRLWDLQAPTAIREFPGHRGAVTAARLLSDARRLVSASEDRTMKLWDLETLAALRTFEGHTGPVDALTVLPGLDYFVSASRDRTLKLWDPLRPTAIATFDSDVPYVVCATVIHDTVVAGDRLGRVHTFRIEGSRMDAAAST